MKQRKLLPLAILAVALVSFGKLRKGFEALEIYNYFKAKELFQSQIEKEPAGAAYGLSIIFSRNDNPFYNLDSAYVYSLKAQSAYFVAAQKQREKLALLNIDSARLYQHFHVVDSLLYYRTIAINTKPEEIDQYLSGHPASAFLDDAAERRDSLAYALALTVDSASAYMEFTTAYPDAKQRKEAAQKYEKALFEEQTAEKTIRAYQAFITNFPESPYVKQAEYAVYSMSTADGLIPDYLRFIDENPESPYVENAWRTIYNLEVRNFNPREIAAFSIKYPNYPFENELLESFRYATTEYYPIEVDGKWGFIDEDGRIMVAPDFEWNEAFSEGLALVGAAGKAGYVDKSGRMVIEPVFDDGFSFKNGFAVVEKNGLYGIINRRGDYIAKPVYEDAGEFSSGFFYVQKNGKYGYLNTSGELAIPFIYDGATDFKNGLAVTEQGGLKGMVDTAGNIILDFDYQWIEGYNKAGGPIRLRKNNKFGFADSSGNIIAEPKFQALGEFSEGLVLAADNNKYGFLNSRGDTVIPFMNDFSQLALQQSYFLNGYARYFRKKEAGIMDTTGKIIFPAIFKDIGTYDPQGLTPVIKQEKWGYANSNVKLVIPYKFDKAQPFSDSTAVVQYKGKYGVIDISGNFVIGPNYTEVVRLDTNLFLVKDTLTGIADLAGNLLLPMIYTSANKMSPKVLQLEQGPLMSYYNLQARQFIWKEEEH